MTKSIQFQVFPFTDCEPTSKGLWFEAGEWIPRSQTFRTISFIDIHRRRTYNIIVQIQNTSIASHVCLRSVIVERNVSIAASLVFWLLERDWLLNCEHIKASWKPQGNGSACRHNSTNKSHNGQHNRTNHIEKYLSVDTWKKKVNVQFSKLHLHS